MTPIMMTLMAVQLGSAAFAFLSAALWLWSALIRLPRATITLIDSEGRRKAPPLEIAMKKQGQVSAAAAATAAVAALLQGFTTIMQIHQG